MTSSLWVALHNMLDTAVVYRRGDQAQEKGLPAVEYLPIKLATVQTAEPRAQCMSIEPNLPGQFRKYNNLDDPTSVYPGAAACRCRHNPEHR